MNRWTKFFLIQATAFLFIGLAGCAPEDIHIYEENQLQPLPILEPNPDIDNVQWLTEDQLVIVIGDPDTVYVDVSLYDLQANTWQDMKYEQPDCPTDRIKAIHPLPDQRLGFIVECRDVDLHLLDPADYLIAWEPSADKFTVLKQYPKEWPPDNIFHPGDFAIAPDFTTIIHDENPGALYSQLHRVSLVDETIENISQGFYRAAWPSWSPDGRRIAFAGNTDGPQWSKPFDIFSGLSNLRSIVYTPWNLYTMNPNGTDVQEVLSGVTFLTFVQWRPSDQNQLAFSGRYGDQAGLWLYDVDSQQLSLLWQDEIGNAVYDWSPDGSQIIFNDCTREDDDPLGYYLCTPTILTVPD